MFSSLGNLDFFEQYQKYFCNMECPEKALSIFLSYLYWIFAVKFLEWSRPLYFAINI